MSDVVQGLETSTQGRLSFVCYAVPRTSKGSDRRPLRYKHITLFDVNFGLKKSW